MGETVVSTLAVFGVILLTLGIVGMLLVRDKQLKLHALSLGALGPIIILLNVAISGNSRMVLTGLLLAAFLAVASAISASAMMSLVRAEQRRRTLPGELSGASPRGTARSS